MNITTNLDGEQVTIINVTGDESSESIVYIDSANNIKVKNVPLDWSRKITIATSADNVVFLDSAGVVVVGDSLTARYTNGGWYEYLHQMSMQRIHNLGNFAQFGWNLDQMLYQVDQALSTKAGTIYIMGGTNLKIFPGLSLTLSDALKSANYYMEQLLRKINHSRKVVIVGIPPASGASISFNADYCEELNRMLQFIAAKWGAEFIYQWEHLVDKSNGGPDESKFQADKIHFIQINHKIAIDRIRANDPRILGCYLPQRNVYTSAFEFFSDPLNLSAGTGPGIATGWGLEAPGAGITSAIPSLASANSGFGRKQILDSNTTSSSPVLTRYFNNFPKGHRGAIVGRMKMITEDSIGSASCYFSIRFLTSGFELIQEDYIQSPIATYEGIFYQEFVAPTNFTYARLQLQFSASKPRSVVEFEQVQIYDIDNLLAYKP